jgi:hypothetical protein
MVGESLVERDRVYDSLCIYNYVCDDTSKITQKDLGNDIYFVSCSRQSIRACALTRRSGNVYAAFYPVKDIQCIAS